MIDEPKKIIVNSSDGNSEENFSLNSDDPNLNEKPLLNEDAVDVEDPIRESNINKQSYIYEVSGKPEFIISGEVNIIKSVYFNVLVRQGKYIWQAITVLLMIYLQWSFWFAMAMSCLYCVVQISTCIYGLWANKELSATLLVTFKINLAKYCSLLLTFTSILLYMSHYISSYVVFLFMILNILVMSIRFFVAYMPRMYVEGQLLDVMEAIQVFVIYLKVLSFISFTWINTIYFYKVYVYFGAIMGCFAAFMLPLMKGIASFHPMNSEQRKPLEFGAWAFFHLFWKGISFWYLFFQILICLNSKNLQENLIINFSDLDPYFLPVMWFFLFCSIINVIYLNQQREIFMKVISGKLLILNSANKGVKRETFMAPIDMKIAHSGANYFKDIISNRNIPDFEFGNNSKVGGTYFIIFFILIVIVYNF